MPSPEAPSSLSSILLTHHPVLNFSFLDCNEIQPKKWGRDKDKSQFAPLIVVNFELPL
jgi:hypothetical protein